MEVEGTSFVKFLGYKRKSKRSYEYETPVKKRVCISLSDIKTQNTSSSTENEMEIDNINDDSPLIQLNNGDYALNYEKIPKNNTFIIPDYLFEGKNDSDCFKGWKYIDFINYFRDQIDTTYYD